MLGTVATCAHAQAPPVSYTHLLSGSVEIAPKLGTADLICDLVSSGATLLANQLKPVETLLESEAVLAGSVREYDDQRTDLAAMLPRPMDGVLKLKAVSYNPLDVYTRQH